MRRLAARLTAVRGSSAHPSANQSDDSSPDHSDDSGSILLQVIGFTVVCALLVWTIVASSAFLLGRQALSDTADGAALAAAASVDLDRYFDGDSVTTLPLSRTGVRSAAQQYLGRTGATRRFVALRLAGVSTDGTDVRVTLTARIRVPLVGLLVPRCRNGCPVSVTSAARSAVG